MAGHSHWAGIRHKKGKLDKSRSKIFSKISREITVAAKLGDKDPDTNPRLRSAIQSARSANMPKENIVRAIDKSSISINTKFESIRYEGFGPYKVGFIIDTLTDNKNRTASSLRTSFQKNNGNLGTQGSAAHNFKNLGVIRLEKKNIEENKLLKILIDLEVENYFSNLDYYEIHCKSNELFVLKNKLEKHFINFISTNIEWLPINLITLDNDKKNQVIQFIDILEENDDVQKVYTNLNFNN